ncbi:DUF692 family multinuclear iron-containing protein [Streptomyces sp. NPDC006368]|uniref:multinuclear nonheme iron-dependent oxidase n=1 Tax=Streptomyces sp. NPDC006368 TaxID=3156760 RepID=UPI0033A2FA76
MTNLGTGIGWRPEIADAVEGLPGVDWVEVVAENICAGHLPDSLLRLRERGVTVVPHGVSLGLGGADRPDAERLAELAAKATALGAPLVTEHIAFVRAGGLEAGHLLPVPRTWDALDVLCENVRIAQEALPVPLALENIAALVSWPGEELTEGRFLAELVARTGVRLLIDVANLHTNHVNRGEDPSRALDELPVEAIAYVHVAGGVERDGVWHDTHAHPVPPQILDVLADLASRVTPPGVLLERDDDFPPASELAAELSAIRGTLVRGRARAPRAALSRKPALTGAALSAAAPSATGVTGAASSDAVSSGAGSCGAAPSGGALPGARQRVGAAPSAAGVTGAGLSGTGLPGAGVFGAGPSAAGVTGAGPSGTGLPGAGSSGAGPSGTGLPGAGVFGAGPSGTGLPGAGVTGAGPSGTGLPGAGVSGAGPSGAGLPGAASPDGELPGARQRVGVAQAGLLGALVAGAEVPEGFDRARLRVQSRALAAKRAGVVAKVAPEVPEIVGDGYRAAFLAYAMSRPMRGGYRRDALDFVEHLLVAGEPADPAARRRLTLWWQDRAGARPPGRVTRFVRAARAALAGR